jgi:hypothetical protein
MAPLSPIAAAALLFLGTCQAHFVLKVPAPIGTLQEEQESNSPCGGYTPDFSSNTISNFMVGGDVIATQSSHPQTTYLYRITTDEKASGNWTQIHHIFQQSGINTFCVPTVTVPESYVGQTAVLSIVADGEDGLLYQVGAQIPQDLPMFYSPFQCAAVKFISGTNTNIPSTCTNSSGVTGSEVDDTALSALLSTSSNSSANGTASGTGSTTSATSTSKPSAGPATYGSLEGVRGLVSLLSMVVVGAGLMI